MEHVVALQADIRVYLRLSSNRFLLIDLRYLV